MRLLILLTLLLVSSAATPPAIFEWAEKAADIEKNLPAYILSLLIWMAMTFGKGVWEWWRRRQSARRRQRQGDYHYLLDKTERINQFTQLALYRTACNYVGAYRLMNGQYFEGGDSLKNMLLVGECAHQSERVLHEARNIPFMSLLPCMYRDMEKVSICIMHTGQAEDYYANKIMFDRGYRTMVAVLARGRKQHRMGVLLFGWNEFQRAEELPQEDILKLARDYSFILTDETKQLP